MYDSQLRLKDELKTTNSNAEKSLHPVAFLRWTRCNSSHRFQAYKGKSLILFKLNNGTPEIKDTLTCREVEVSFKGGLVTHWRSKSLGDFAVGAQPVELVDNVFLWMPKYATVALHEYREGTSATVPVVWKTAMNPATKVDGIFFLMERRAFEDTYGPLDNTHQTKRG